jgi:hypothetical protein
MTAPAPHTRGECDWCREPLGNVADEWNGGFGCPECVAQVARDVFPDGPGPYIHRRRFYRADPGVAFLERLAYEAVLLGIDTQKLATAVKRARHGC